MKLKLALPKGWLQGYTATLLDKLGFQLDSYHERSRSYRPVSRGFPELFVKVFHEKDIAIQVAIGNYDLGICGLDWVDELLAKYPSDAVLKIRSLGYGHGNIYVAASRFSRVSIDELQASDKTVCIVSEYPNLAESYALKLRLRRFKVLPVMGAAEVYPPENADLAILAETSEEELYDRGLVPLDTVGITDAFLIANRDRLEQIDMSGLLEPLSREQTEGKRLTRPAKKVAPAVWEQVGNNVVRLALPDGHQQQHTVELLKRAGVKIHGYRQGSPSSRPQVEINGVAAKVIRPQDMPLQVANDNFDLAITGKDWLLDHLYKFPSSPIAELLDLNYGKVQIVAVVSKEMPVDSLADLKEMMKSGKLPTLRVASEYINIADKYARDNHLAPYQIIPTWGASESFLPEDADLLIENMETGTTLAKHNLKIIDTLLESSACIIGNKNAEKSKLVSILKILQRGRTN